MSRFRYRSRFRYYTLLPADIAFLIVGLSSVPLYPEMSRMAGEGYLVMPLLVYLLGAGWIPFYFFMRIKDEWMNFNRQFHMVLCLFSIVFFMSGFAWFTGTLSLIPLATTGLAFIVGSQLVSWRRLRSKKAKAFWQRVARYQAYRDGAAARVKERKEKRAEWIRVNHIDTLPTGQFDPVAFADTRLQVPLGLRFQINHLLEEWWKHDGPLTKDEAIALYDRGADVGTIRTRVLYSLSTVRDRNSYDQLGLVISRINTCAKVLPDHKLITLPAEGSDTWGKYLWPSLKAFLDGKPTKEQMSIYHACTSLPALIKNGISEIPITLEIPMELRYSHHHIVGGTGQGKTQLLQSMILKDIKDNHSVVIIDSQGQLIQNVQRLSTIPEERLVVIDPTDIEYPPAISLFSFAGKDATDPLQKEQAVNSAVEMYEYIFSALDASMTSKQSTAYRYLARLMFEIPGANIQTLRKALEPGAVLPYDRLGETAQSFFKNEYDSKQFAETRQQILRRLYTLLESQVFERMFSAGESKLDLKQEIDKGSIILINTAKSLLRETGSSIFGRFWIGQITQAVFQRNPNSQGRTQLYIDEFHEYASEGYINVLLEQGRKYGLSLVVAHQNLSQLSPKILSSLASNTSVKYAGGVSSADARALASQMQTTPEFILEQKTGNFAVFLRDSGVIRHSVTFGEMEQESQRTDTEMRSLREAMRRRFSVTSPSTDPNGEHTDPPPPPSVDDGLTKW